MVNTKYSPFTFGSMCLNCLRSHHTDFLSACTNLSSSIYSLLTVGNSMLYIGSYPLLPNSRDYAIWYYDRCFQRSRSNMCVCLYMTHLCTSVWIYSNRLVTHNYVSNQYNYEVLYILKSSF